MSLLMKPQSRKANLANDLKRDIEQEIEALITVSSERTWPLHVQARSVISDSPGLRIIVV